MFSFFYVSEKLNNDVACDVTCGNEKKEQLLLEDKKNCKLLVTI